jgi:hypothetical protein
MKSINLNYFDEFSLLIKKQFSFKVVVYETEEAKECFKENGLSVI